MIDEEVSDDRRFAGPRNGLSSTWMVFAFVVSMALVFSRRPGDLIHAQFYAEDGLRWFAQAYNFHWLRSLLMPDASYLQVLPRLFAGAALLVPLERAPLVLNLAGAALQALPVVALLSRRCCTWGSLPLRFALAAVYLASPNVHEIHINITNAQWHFGLLQVLLAFGHPPRTKLGKISDIFIFVVGSVSGPFGLVLLPLMVAWWWTSRQRWTLVLAACLVAGSLMQLQTLAHGYTFAALRLDVPVSARVRLGRIPLGATTPLFLRIVGDRVFLDSLLGDTRLDRGSVVIAACFFVIGLFVSVCGLLWGPRPFRFFTVYAVALFAAALRSPVIDDPVSRWHALSIDPGMRYFFLPMLVFLWAALYAIKYSPVRGVRVACLLLMLLLVGGLRKWKYEAFPVSRLQQYVQVLDRAKPGESVVIPIYPESWTMTLIKRQ